MTAVLVGRSLPQTEDLRLLLILYDEDAIFVNSAHVTRGLSEYVHRVRFVAGDISSLAIEKLNPLKALQPSNTGVDKKLAEIYYLRMISAKCGCLFAFCYGTGSY